MGWRIPALCAWCVVSVNCLDRAAGYGPVDAWFSAEDSSTSTPDASEPPDGATAPQLCGNEVIDPGEQCDGLNLGQTSCTDLGFSAGILSCSDDCTFNSSGCRLCGNDVCEPGESSTDCPEDCHAIAVSAGATHTCALMNGGRVRCWGANDHGQLGDGTYHSSLVPVSVLNLVNAVAISTGTTHTCALKAGGTVWCWGANWVGQLGDGNNNTSSAVPVMVLGLGSAIAVSVGQDHTCAVVNDGSAWCWGDNFIGQLGDSSRRNSNVPIAVPDVSGAIGISAHDHYTCVHTSTGKVICWPCGSLNDPCGLRPVEIAGISNAVAVSVGGTHRCANLGNGTVRCWGNNQHGQLGDGTNTDSTDPVVVFGIASAQQVSAGCHNACALLTDGAVWCWGEEPLGDGTTNDSNVPVAVTGLSDVVEISAGFQHICTVAADGGVWCWGANFEGMLGTGDYVSTEIPVQVIGL